MVATRSFTRQLRELVQLAQPPRWAGPVIILLGLGAAVLEGLGLVLFIPLLQSLGAPAGAQGLQRLLDGPMAAIPPAYATAFLVALLCASILLKNAVNTLNIWVTRYVDGRVAHELRTRIFDQTLSSCLDYRAGVRRSDIATTLGTNSWRVSSALTLLYRLMVSLITFLVFAGIMTGISPSLTLVALGFLTVAGLVIRFCTRQADATGKAVVEENKQFGLRMWESIESLQLIRAFGREGIERERFGRASDSIRLRLLKLDLLWAIPGPVSEIAITLLIGALILAAQSTGIGIASLAAFLSLLYRLQGPTRELMQSKVAFDGLGGSIDDVADLLSRSSTPYLVDGTENAAPLETGIEFRNVSFRYADEDGWALQDASFFVPAGRTTAIVGESGAGKSTLLSLLFRFQDPSRGAVLADGRPLTAMRIADWRAQIAVMSQDVQLFSDSIEANISFGRPQASADEIRNAARVARADGFIDALPDGFSTTVGDRGLRLSGGQRQRIALARTILRNPSILMLDEATNSLDAESEQAFQLALDRFAHRRTVIVVAHRLSTVQNADQIIVLAKGRVIESGPPAELLRAGGAFARMFDIQHGRHPAQQDSR